MIYYIEGTGSDNKIYTDSEYIDSEYLKPDIIRSDSQNLLKLLSELVHGDASPLAKAISNIIKHPNQFSI